MVVKKDPPLTLLPGSRQVAVRGEFTLAFLLFPKVFGTLRPFRQDETIGLQKGPVVAVTPGV